MQLLRFASAYAPRQIVRNISFPTMSRSNSTSAKDWSAALYLKFEKERSRPSRDLIAQVPLTNPKRVIDLGCGPGNSTAILRERYPNAELSGLDSSPDMLKKARANLPDVSFKQADLTTYTPEASVDLFFSNATFQWLPHDARIATIKRLLESQSPGGVVAVQVPDNFDEPSHAQMRSIAEGGPWADILRPLNPARTPFQTAQEIYNELKPLCEDLDLWHSVYYHVLQDHEAVVEWVKGTGLRPFIDPLNEDMRNEFLRRYLSAIKETYTASVDGKVILRYPRLFIVATKAGK
jgi:trans-aconitate 2-methyltransferase